MSERSLLFELQKRHIEKEKKTFTVDHFSLVWEAASNTHKRFLLKLAGFDLEPKYWGGYDKQEQRTLHSVALWAEEFAKFQQAVKQDSKRLEKRINARD